MLIVICGATATGKSELALHLAQKLNSIIISADSRQVYREFDLGTAKPSPEQLSLVPHYFINSHHPQETLTVADYQESIQALIAQQLQLTPTPPLLVGGTGLYIKAIVKGLKIPRVAPQEQLRSQLLCLGQSQLYQFLSQVDPLATKKIHPHDQVRTLRALEVYYVTGKPISAQQGENPPAYPILQIGLDCPPDLLKDWISQRTHHMIEAGFVEEVERLIAKYGADLPLLQTLGYSEIQQFLQKQLSLSQATDQIIIHTRQFAKRQRTWFRRYPEIEWFDATSSHLKEAVCQRIELFMNRHLQK